MGGVEHGGGGGGGGGQVHPSKAQTPFSASKGMQSSSCALNGILS